MALSKKIGVVASVVLLSAGLVACNKGTNGSLDSPNKPSSSNSASQNPSTKPTTNPSGPAVDWAPFVGTWDFVAEGTTAKTLLAIDAKGTIKATEQGKTYTFKGTLTSSGPGTYVLLMVSEDKGGRNQTLALTKGANDKTYQVVSDNGQRGTLTKSA